MCFSYRVYCSLLVLLFFTERGISSTPPELLEPVLRPRTAFHCIVAMS